MDNFYLTLLNLFKLVSMPEHFFLLTWVTLDKVHKTFIKQVRKHQLQMAIQMFVHKLYTIY